MIINDSNQKTSVQISHIRTWENLDEIDALAIEPGGHQSQVGKLRPSHQFKVRVGTLPSGTEQPHTWVVGSSDLWL